MSRLPGVVLAVLAAATIGAFFVVQHLKVTTPLIAAPSAPNPPAINPVARNVCGTVAHWRTDVSFYLLHRSDHVDVYVIDPTGAIVATLASDVYMPGSPHPVRKVFTWNGVEDNGSVPPDGLYEVEVALREQGRTVVLTPQGSTTPFTIKVETRAPHPVVRSVAPRLIPVHGRTRAHITYTGNEGHLATVDIYRTDVPGLPRLVERFLNPSAGQVAVWDGRLGGRTAPAGVYLVGLEVTDAACNTGRFPGSWPPTPGATAGAGVSVRYLAALPPLVPVRSGRAALTYIDSRGVGYRWALRAPGSTRVLAHGSARRYALQVPTPAAHTGAYELALTTGSHRTVVPLLVTTGRYAPALVVLPALSWEGLTAVDDTGDGLPDTLTDGAASTARLDRPLVGGLPSDFADEAALLSYLASAHVPYELTTDLALDVGAGPPLGTHRLVVLAGAERWIPTRLGRALRAYVTRGGHVLSLGLGSLRAFVTVSGAQARNPQPVSPVDLFGIRHSADTASGSGLVGELYDRLGVFSGWSGVLSVSGGYEPIAGVQSPGRLLSAAGLSASALGVAGVRLGAGTVVEIGVRGFAAQLDRSLDARQLLDGIWSVLSR